MDKHILHAMTFVDNEILMENEEFVKKYVSSRMAEDLGKAIKEGMYKLNIKQDIDIISDKNQTRFSTSVAVLNLDEYKELKYYKQKYLDLFSKVSIHEYI